MKKLLLLTFILTAFTMNAQDSKGYVGMSIGLAMPTGDLADIAKTGLDLGLINAGYRFNETWGATLNWGSTGHSLDGADGTIGVGYFGIGPMISYGNFDFKPQYAFGSGEIDIDNVGDEDFDIDSAWIIGATYNVPLGGNWGMAANFDYFTFKPEDADDSLNMFKLSVGVQYKF